MFQISSSIMDACILAALEQGDTYGYELTQNVKKHVLISESTLYPVLRRLQKDHCLDVYDTPVNGRNRRYYRITEAGKQKLSEYRSEWDSYKKTVDGILKGSRSHDQKRIYGHSEGQSSRNVAGRKERYHRVLRRVL